MKQKVKSNRTERKINQEVAKIIKKLSKKYSGVWEDLAKI